MVTKADAVSRKAHRRKESKTETSVGQLPVTSHQHVHILPLIRGLIPNLRRAQLRIAKVVVSDPEQFINQPISQLAKCAGVSAGAIVQFCKSLNLKGLPALKIALARELAEPVLAFTKGTREEDDSAYTLQRVFQEHVNSLNQTMQLNNAAALNAAADLLLKARRIVLFSIGLSYPVAYSLYARLRFIGFPAFIEYDSHLQLAAAAEMAKSEVAIGFSLSGSTSETVECLRVSRARHAKTICITNSVESPITRSADVKLYAAPSEVKYFQAPLASRVSQLALADALLVILGQRKKQRAVTHLRRAEEHLLNRRLL
jgi:DNA-binding MurR/RpiR family transcriptional regulator